MGRLGWASRLVVATLVATLATSGVGALPWLERSDTDGTEELGVEWNSLAGSAGAATVQSGLTCPSGMVLDGELCKTPTVETAEVMRVCPQPGYEVVITRAEQGASHTCQRTVPPFCEDPKVLHEGQCQTKTTTEKTEYEQATWACSDGTLVTSSGDHGVAHNCKIALDPPTCPAGEQYRTAPSEGCYEEGESFYETASYQYTCPSGYSLGHDGLANTCTKTVSPYCTGEKSYRTSPSKGCYEEESYYKTATYRYRCPSGYSLGHDGLANTCTKTVSPYCTGGKSYRTSPRKGCYESEQYYRTASYRYRCPSGYTLKTSGTTRSCTKTEKYRKRVCSFDPIAGEQCWYENRTRTLTKSVIRYCPSGYSANGSNCRADSASTRWRYTTSQPITKLTRPATRYCPSGYSANGSNCRADSASMRWRRTTSQPITKLTQPATPYCPSGYSANGPNCRADSASKRWRLTASQPLTTLTQPAEPYCDAGYSDNGTRCQADVATVPWDLTDSTPKEHRYDPADPSCTTEGFTYSQSNSRCEKTTAVIAYSDPTAPLTVLFGKLPVPSCDKGWTLSAGSCKRTVLGDPTALPTGAACIDNLGTLRAGTHTRTGTLAAGCPSEHKGDKQSPHWARRYRLRVAAASTATITASSSAADVDLVVQSGSGTGASVIAQDDDSGSGTDAEAADVELAEGTDYIVEVTTSVAGTSGAFTLTIVTAYDEPPVVITGFAGATKIGSGVVTASDEFTVEPADATCTAAAPVAKPTVTDGDTAAKRIASLRMAAPFSRLVTVTCDADARSPAQATAKLSGAAAIGTVIVAAGRACSASPGTADYVCTVPRNGTLAVTATAQGADQGLSLAWAVAGGAAAASPTQTAVTPVPPSSYSRTSTATLSCTADGTATVTVTAGLATRTVTIDVDCAGTATAVACDDPLGSLAHGTITRSGTITKDAACTSTRRRPRSSAAYYAKRHTFSLDGPATVTVGLGAAGSGSERLDTYLILHQGHNAGVTTPLRRNSSRLRNMRLAAGAYTIEATTQLPGHVGDYTLTVNVRYHRTVAISDVTGAVGAGTGPVRVSGAFTVTPPTAHCTATPSTAVVVTPPAAISDPRLGGQRTVSAALSEPGTAQVTVGCTAAGYRPAQKNAALVHAGALQSITARVSGGGQCTTASTPSGADAHYRCTIGRGNTMTVAADAASTGPTVDIAWTATAGVTSRLQSQPAAVPSFPPRSTSPVYQRTATAELSCTANGTATAAATLPGTTARKTALLTVTCADAVAIVGLVDVTEHGTGTVPVSAGFTVNPTSANCGADPSTASVTAGRNGLRTVSASMASPGSLAVTVTCKAAGYADGIRKVTLAAALPCAEHLGDLAAGVTRRSGTVTADRACNSAERHRAGRDRGRSGTYHAKRHTFTMPNPGWVTVDLVGAVSDGRRFNTYLNLLDGHSPLGAVAASDNNSGRYSNARLVEEFLEAGRYTIEATTARPKHTGDYTLTINVDFTPRAETQPTRLSVKKGGSIRTSWPYGPAAATVTVAAPDSLGATVSRSTTTGSKGSVTLAATPTSIGKFSAKVTYTNGSGSLSKDTNVIVVDGSCPPSGNGGLRARQMHHHDDGSGHAGCDAHEPLVCTSSYSNPWTPDGRRGHLERNLKQCSSKYNVGIINDSELELLPWSPYDMDRAGRPVLCQEVSPVLFRKPSDQLRMCLEKHNLALVTWASGFDVDTAIAEYENERGRTVPANVRRDLQTIQRAIDHDEAVLVGTSALPRLTGVTALDDAFQEILCKAVVGRTVGTVAAKATKKVGAWAANKIPILQGLTKVNAVLSIISTVVGVAYSNFAQNALCE